MYDNKPSAVRTWIRVVLGINMPCVPQALDCFTAMQSKAESRLKLAEIIGSKLNVSKEKVQIKISKTHQSKKRYNIYMCMFFFFFLHPDVELECSRFQKKGKSGIKGEELGVIYLFIYFSVVLILHLIKQP